MSYYCAKCDKKFEVTDYQKSRFKVWCVDPWVECECGALNQLCFSEETPHIQDPKERG
jgi:hypothetical protein